LIGVGLGVTPDHAEYPALREAFLAYYAEGLAVTTRLFDGVAPMLDALDARGMRWGIVTNKTHRYTIPVLEWLGLARRAGVIVSGDTTAHPKPHPAPLLHAAQALGVAASACAYVGDDLRDVVAGNSASMTTLVADYGYLGESGSSEGWPAAGWIDAPLGLLDWLA
jgi:phosphoglycolate phosphatase